MALPFVPFPMFCPYAQWSPAGYSQFPENVDVLKRLSAVDAACFPFICIRYCQRYLAWLAHSWTPGNAQQTYYFETLHLERLLNWCFSRQLSLLDLTSDDLYQYASFFCAPSTDWCVPASRPKFNPEPLVPYANWKLNGDWRPFLSAARDTSSQLGMAQVVINRFFSFFYREVSNPSPAPSLCGFCRDTKQKSHKLTEFEIDWYMASLGALPFGERYKHIILVWYALARWSKQPPRRLMGYPSSPGLLNQFHKGANGLWVESLLSGEAREMDVQFSIFFDSYLRHLDLDPDQHLPPVKLFDTSPDGKFARKCRGILVQMARNSEDSNVRIAAEKFQNLTFSLLRKSPRS